MEFLQNYEITGVLSPFHYELDGQNTQQYILLSDLTYFDVYVEGIAAKKASLLTWQDVKLSGDYYPNENKIVVQSIQLVKEEHQKRKSIPRLIQKSVINDLSHSNVFALKDYQKKRRV